MSQYIVTVSHNNFKVSHDFTFSNKKMAKELYKVVSCGDLKKYLKVDLKVINGV